VVAAPDTGNHPLTAHQRRIGHGLGWEVREHRGEPLFAHNGRFDGAASYMAFMPSRGFGVGVLANTSGQAMFLVEAIGVEAFETLLGHDAPDAVDRVLAMAARPRPAAADTAAGRLSGPPARYAGRYANDTWGLLRIEARGPGLEGRIGDLPMPLRVTGTDRVIADGEYPGEFVFGASDRPRGLFLRMAPGDSAWFERR
jgi:hypothetical protein